jgi:RNA polymerase sigma-70 factor (family 1)
MTEKDFEHMFNTHWSRLYSLAYNYFRDKATAQEVTQEVFISLWGKRDQLHEVQSMDAYLNRCVKNKIYDYFDKIHSQERLQQRFSLVIKSETDCTQEELDYTETLHLVNEEIEQLPETTKQVFRLSRFERYSNAEIAGRLKLSGKAVEYHITQALKRLRVRFTHILSIVVALFGSL